MATTERVQWLDVARGIAILLVVLLHSAVFLLQADLTIGQWRDANEMLSTFRMPLFFLASGLLAGSAMERSWSSLWTKRLSLLLWVFLLWTVVRFGFFTLLPFEGREFESDPIGLLLAPISPSTGLWFLHALIVFLIVAKAMFGRVAPLVQLGIFAVVSAFALSIVDLGNLSYDGMLRYFVFFLIGIHCKALVLSVTEKTNWVATLFVFVGFALVAIATNMLELERIVGVREVGAILAVLAGILGSAILARTILRRPLAYLGRNTLSIYVIHVLVVAAVVSVMQIDAFPEVPYCFRVLMPILVALVAVVISLLVRFALVHIGLGWVFSPPKWFSGTERTRTDFAETRMSSARSK